MPIIEKALDGLIAAGRRLYRQGVMPGGDGNLSARTADGILITTSGRCKGELESADFVLVSPAGDMLSDGVPSSELPMHLAIYRKLPEINAVVHCHGPFTVALTVAGASFRGDIIPEVRIKYGAIPVTDFALPSTVESAEVLLPHLVDGFVGAILPRHGIVTAGADIESAVLAAEGIEYASRVQYLSMLLGRIEPFPGAEE